MKKKTRTARSSRKVVSRRSQQFAKGNKRTIIWIAVLFVAIFFVVAALKTKQTVQQQAANTPGAVCLQMNGTCNTAGSCAVFQTDKGPQDCGTGQSCCVSTSTGTVPSPNCLGNISCVTPSVSAMPGTTTNPLPSTLISAAPSASPSGNPLTSGIPSGSVSPGLSQPPGVSGQPPSNPPGSNSLINLIKQLLNLIKQLLNQLGALLGGGNNNNSGTGGDNDKNNMQQRDEKKQDNNKGNKSEATTNQTTHNTGNQTTNN